MCGSAATRRRRAAPPSRRPSRKRLGRATAAWWPGHIDSIGMAPFLLPYIVTASTPRRPAWQPTPLRAAYVKGRDALLHGWAPGADHRLALDHANLPFSYGRYHDE